MIGWILWLILWLAGYGSPDQQDYMLETLTDATAVSGVAFGDYTAISNNARLAAVFDDTFDPSGLVTAGRFNFVTDHFRVGAPFQSFTWYTGINNRRATVGYTQDFTAPVGIAAWMRDRHGNVQTYSEPGADVYLYRLNDKGDAVGEIVNHATGSFQPVVADADGLEVMQVPGIDPGLSAYFNDNNNWGAIIGGAIDPLTFQHTPFVWTWRGVNDITHDDAADILPRSINNFGQIAGTWYEPGIDPVLGQPRPHGFIRQPNGQFITMDLDLSSLDFPPSGPVDPNLFGGYPVIAAHQDLLDTTNAILDMNDRGQLVIEATAWYLVTLELDGLGTQEFVQPLFSFAVATPKH